MTLLFLLLSLIIGINLRFSIVAGIIETVLILFFSLKRFSKKHFLIFASTILIGFGVSFIRPSFNKSEYKCFIIEVKENYFIASSSFEKLYVYEKNNEREIGDIVSIKGIKKELSFTHLESEFDFGNYLNKKGVYSEITQPQIETIFASPLKIQKLKKNFLSQFNEDTRGLIGSLLFGSSKDGDVSEQFLELHLIRLISNSGIFLYFFYKLICFLLSYLVNEKYTKLISCLIFAIYSIFTFPRFVVIKFVTLLFLKWLNEYAFKQKISYLNLLCITGMVFLLLDYNLARQDSFILAYFIPIISLFINGSFRKLTGIKKKAVVSIIISLFFIPFTINYYNELSPLSLPFQLIFTPIMLLYSLIGAIGLFGIPISTVLNGFTNLIGNICNFLKPIFFKIYIPSFENHIILLYEIMLFFTVYIFSIKLKSLYKITVLIFTSFICLNCIPLQRIFNVNVYFINVGQGDACLITHKNTSILIDTGGNLYKDIAKDCLIPFFKKQQIYKLDVLITTHDDFDHNGAVASLFENFKVKSYFTNYTSFPLKVGDLSIFNLNKYTDDWNEDNDKSLVLFFSINSINFLLMGDAPKKIETNIINEYKNLKCDIIKIGHHGSSTSTSSEFIKEINPKEAVISVGKNNYGHPENSVIDILNKYNVKIRRTDIEGTICYSL